MLLISVILSQQLMAQSYQKIHAKAIVVDTHNDILSQTMEKGYVFDNNLKGLAHSDLARWKEGGLDVQLFSVFVMEKKKNLLSLPIAKWIHWMLL
nr:membrane dipeptidase [Flavobacterium soyangense]